MERVGNLQKTIFIGSEQQCLKPNANCKRILFHYLRNYKIWLFLVFFFCFWNVKVLRTCILFKDRPLQRKLAVPATIPPPPLDENLPYTLSGHGKFKIRPGRGGGSGCLNIPEYDSLHLIRPNGPHSMSKCD